MELKDIVAYVITPLLTALLTMFHIYMNIRFQNMSERIKKLEIEVEKLKIEEKEIKENYIDRFDKITMLLHNVKDEIIHRINGIDVKVEKQATMLGLIQEEKRK